MEILKRLPVKSILRFRCVQKYWFSLIQSPYFIALHSRHQSNMNKFLLFYNRGYKRFSLRFDDKQCEEYSAFQFSQHMLKKLYLECELIYETSNGLICVSATKTNKVYLWNPIIRKFKTLHIWVLENEGATQEIWKKKTSLKLEQRPMGFRNNGEALLYYDYQFWLYDLEKKEAKEFVDHDLQVLDALDMYGLDYPFPQQGFNRFKENLVLLNDMDTEDEEHFWEF